MSSPPLSPTLSHRRNPSNISTSAQNDSTASRRRSYNRRSSGFQGYSPLQSPVQQFDGEQDIPPSGAGGLGSLADELGETWDEDDEGIDEESQVIDGGSRNLVDRGRAHEKSLNGLTAGHRRNESMYDGSDYGEEDDLASDGITAGLEKEMAEVESLARRGLETNGSASDGVVARVTENLRDLGSQAGVESSASRLTTAHASLASHITHQTRHLTSLTSTLFSPLAPPIPPDVLDSILPLIECTIPLIPDPSSLPLQSLASLSHGTSDLLATLSVVSDNLHMARQNQATAQRRLRSVRETLAEWRRENDARDEGIRYIEKGDWEKKLGDRESKRVCDGVVSGFEEQCDGLRKRLVDGLGA